MLSLFILHLGQKCVSNLHTANTLGFPITSQVSVTSNGFVNLSYPRFYNLIEDICLCSNQRTLNGITIQGAVSNGICEDEGTNALYDFGTDCDDCGSRGNYPSYQCGSCTTYDTVILTDVYDSNSIVDGVYCMTPYANVLYSQIFNFHSLSFLETGSEVCLLYIIENGKQVPFQLQSQNIVIHNNRNAFSGLQTTINVSNTIYNVPGTEFIDPAIYISFSLPGDYELQITTQNSYYSYNVKVINDDAYPILTDIVFQNSVIITQMYKTISQTTFTAYIPYSMLSCTQLNNNLYSVNTDCSLNSEYNKLLLQTSTHISSYPFITQIKFPKYSNYLPIIRTLENDFRGMITLNTKYLEENRLLFEVYVTTQQLSAIQLYGLQIKHENISKISNGNCHNHITSNGLSLTHKTDGGGENFCVWTHKNKITSMNLNSNFINVIYAKIPASYNMLNPVNGLIYLFGIEMEYTNNTFTFELENDPTIVYLTSQTTRVSPMCTTQEDITQQKFIMICKPSYLYNLYSSPIMSTKMPIKSIPTSTLIQPTTTLPLDTSTCLNDNILYTTSNIQFGSQTLGFFSPIGPNMTSIHCNYIHMLYNSENMKYTSSNVCDIMNNYIAKVDEVYHYLSCCSCNTYTNPPMAPTMIQLPAQPPLQPLPPHLPPPPSTPPHSPPENLSDQTILVSKEQDNSNNIVSYSLVCNRNNNLVMNISGSTDTTYLGSPCNSPTVNICQTIITGDICTVNINSISSWHAQFTSNFNPPDFLCTINYTKQENTCNFTAASIRAEYFAPSPSPPPQFETSRWVYSSVNHCQNLLQQGIIDYYTTRTYNHTTVNFNTSFIETSPYHRTCAMFTTFDKLVEIPQLSYITYEFLPGYQFAPISNYTNINLQFTAYINDYEYSYPGNDTNTLNFIPFLMNSHEHKILSIQVPST